MLSKDPFLPKHQHITSVPNIAVMIIVWLLKSRKHLNGVFNWQWSYCMLNDAGVKYLCEYLGLPEDIVSKTYKKIKVTRENKERKTRVANSRFSENKGAKSKCLLDMNIFAISLLFIQKTFTLCSFIFRKTAISNSCLPFLVFSSDLDLLVSFWDDVFWESKVFTKVLHSCIIEHAVASLPIENSI